MKTSKRLADILTKLNASNRVIARIAGVSESSVRAWRTGHKKPSDASLKRISGHIGLDFKVLNGSAPLPEGFPSPALLKRVEAATFSSGRPPGSSTSVPKEGTSLPSSAFHEEAYVELGMLIEKMAGSDDDKNRLLAMLSRALIRLISSSRSNQDVNIERLQRSIDALPILIEQQISVYLARVENLHVQFGQHLEDWRKLSEGSRDLDSDPNAHPNAKMRAPEKE